LTAIDYFAGIGVGVTVGLLNSHIPYASRHREEAFYREYFLNLHEAVELAH